MWTRLLCWDRKWFYIVTHFVPKGSVAPVGWTLDPPSNFGVLPSFLNPKKGGKNGTGTGFPDATVDMSEVDRSKIFASAISKYVMKVGRLTIHPEAILSLSNLLPPRQGGWNTMSGPSSEVQTPEEGEVDEQTTMLGDSVFTHIPVAHGAVGSENGGVKEAVAENDAGWTWQMIEAENEKGLKLANNFAELDGLPEAFTGNSAPALGYYPDLF